MLTPTDINEIRRIAEDYNTALAIRVFGSEALGLSADEVARLVKAGLIDEGAALSLDVIKDAHLLGSLRAQVQMATGQQIAPLTREQLVATMASQRLSKMERYAISSARQTAGQHVTALGRRLADEIAGKVAAEDAALRAERVAIIQDKVSEGLARREGARRIASQLRDATQDATRDWLRVASTEAHNAQEISAAMAIRDDFGEDARVAKVPNPDSCAACRRLYLENGRPKIFKLSELSANGTNIGRKQAEWKAVLGTIHPFCCCTLHFCPVGYSFTSEEDGWLLRRESKIKPETEPKGEPK